MNTVYVILIPLFRIVMLGNGYIQALKELTKKFQQLNDETW